MKPIRKVGIVRRRGQFTFPDAIRDVAKWLAENGVVIVTLALPDELRIRPYRKSAQKLDWKTVRKRMEKIRNFPGENVNLSGFIARDRQTRR